ncbi:hypothetical protein G5I_12327 [Acromyrmex echinatior]|uniref:Uncharacterized protein n=1 Tax=Acromyrmex echinatior TaxID=103372 RepID=F4X208_ACREC|nr:hypothetical protein G5I_12327 [Acromyrmex echinatior]
MCGNAPRGKIRVRKRHKVDMIHDSKENSVSLNYLNFTDLYPVPNMPLEGNKMRSQNNADCNFNYNAKYPARKDEGCGSAITTRKNSELRCEYVIVPSCYFAPFDYCDLYAIR